jgi:hypothetical protein
MPSEDGHNQPKHVKAVKYLQIHSHWTVLTAILKFTSADQCSSTGGAHPTGGFNDFKNNNPVTQPAPNCTLALLINA